MHYYTFNIADYRKDTTHLEPLEHYIYRTLMDSYYLDETPIPKKTESVMRRLRLGCEYNDLLLNVLNDFFVLDSDGWHHKRIDEKISDYKNKSKINSENGKKGGRPKKQQLTSDNKPEKTQSVNSAKRSESEKKPNQEPITNNQELNKKKKKKKPPTATLDYENLFSEFWSIWPKRGDTRKTAFDKYKIKCKNLETADRIISGLRNQLPQYQSCENKFIPAASTWLNQERWNNEAEIKKTTGSMHW